MAATEEADCAFRSFFMSDLPTEKISTLYGTFHCWPDDFINRQLIDFGAHARNELSMLRKFIEPGDNIVDVGAHIGSFAVPFARFNQGLGSIFAFEAHPGNFRLLCMNITENGLDSSISPVNAIVFDRDATFKVLQSAAGNTGTFTFLPDSPPTHHVPVLSLDAWHQVRGAHLKVHLLKIDVEGAELSVLNSARKLIVSSRPMLYIEIHQAGLARFNVMIGQVEEFLRTLGYELFRNFGERNSTNDAFRMKRIDKLESEGTFFDVLAIHRESPRLAMALALTTGVT
jgi:FkbM family methyltransferase